MLVGREMHFFLAVGAAAAFIFGRAIVALNEEQVTTIVLAVGMGIAWLAADVAFGEDVIGDAFAQAFIEDEVLAFELYR